MNKIRPLDQNGSIDANALNRTSKVQIKNESEGSILDKLKEFASSVPDFRRTSKGSIRHRLDDIIMLMLFSWATERVDRNYSQKSRYTTF